MRPYFQSPTKINSKYINSAIDICLSFVTQVASDLEKVFTEKGLVSSYSCTPAKTECY